MIPPKPAMVVDADRAVELVWNNDPSVKDLVDPRNGAFANAVIGAFGRELARTPALIQQVMAGAASAAEDLNVEPYQGLIEVLQNADDLGAHEIRFAFRDHGDTRQLLIVHNGAPVTFAHILPMTLPFLTTKGDDADQKGRFGIGLKTLARISSRLTVHCEPYHFQAEQLALSLGEPEENIPGFYNVRTDTLLVLDLKSSFEIDGLQQWFDAWDEDGLLFLSSVRSFRWCDLNGETLGAKSIVAGDWIDVPYVNMDNGISSIRERTMRTHAATWHVYCGQVLVPAHLKRAHKAKGHFTPISFAVPDIDIGTGLFIAFKTRVQTSLAISIDAQFDPSTAREELIDNAWNRWLINRCASVIAAVAIEIIGRKPAEVWRLVPLSTEMIGASPEQWPGKQFFDALERVREAVGQSAILIDGEYILLAETAYEVENLTPLLDSDDVQNLSGGKKVIPRDIRDTEGRWRLVLDDIGVCQVVDSGRLLTGMAGGHFVSKSPQWWVEAGAILVESYPSEKIFGQPFLLSADQQVVSCAKAGSTSRLLVSGDGVSAFARRWRLLDKLHDVYGHPGAGERVRDWLTRRAAYTIDPDPALELAAFAELNADGVEVSDEQLREIRDRFDAVGERSAAKIGLQVGRALRLNCHIYKNQKKRSCKVSPTEAYLPKTLDSEHPDWPEAAGDLPGITWLSASYDEVLKSSTGRQSRRRAEGGGMSRGARRFLMLLGAECAPRLVTEEGFQYPSRNSQRLELARINAELVEANVRSPDLERVLVALPRMSKRDRKIRAAALMRGLSRHWQRVFSTRQTVSAYHVARRYRYSKGDVSAEWLCMLKDTAWIVVGNGDLSEPSKAVLRSPQTETLYDSKTFIAGVEASEINNALAVAIGLITAVRASDLMAHLRAIKLGEKSATNAEIMQVYRTLSKLCSPASEPWGDVGDVSAHDVRREFSSGSGLMRLQQDGWKKPSDFFSGRDIFHEPQLFVPSAAAYADLWRTLQIRKPELSDCARYCRNLALKPYSVNAEAALIDTYRYMEDLLAEPDRRNVKGRLATLPLACSGLWADSRPIVLVENSEVRDQLTRAFPGMNFWNPPCELSSLPNFLSAIDVEKVNPQIAIAADSKAAGDEGDNWRDKFQAVVESLSSELARNEPATREKISITWDALRDMPLFIYPKAFEVSVSHDSLNGGAPFRISLRAFLEEKQGGFHVAEEAIGMPKTGGRAVASLFPWEVRSRIEAQWAASWLESQSRIVETMRFASDEERNEKLRVETQLLADSFDATGGKIEVSAPASRASSAKPRRLKLFQGGVSGITVNIGNLPAANGNGSSAPLLSTAPSSSGSSSAGSKEVAPVEFTVADLEQRGWEILSAALDRSDAPLLSDFRKRHGVGADGAIDWQKFVELKASARSLPSSVEMTNAEYERAKERGSDYILALVYGLEEGERTEARLIVDPINNLSIRPTAGIRLVGLAQANAVILTFAEAPTSSLVADTMAVV